jgi:NTP pyrophosphatase (non-canonical NTP hydrolase)
MFDIGSRVWPGISKLIEECAEVVQVCGKLIALRGERRHWDGTDLKERLEDEVGDGYAAAQFVIEHCGLDIGRIRARASQKHALFEKWHAEHKEAA